MGYKSYLRAQAAEQRRNLREMEKLQKEQDKINKKFLKVEEKKQNIIEALDNYYAKGKIDDNKFNKLKKREDDIEVDLIIFGKAAYISAAKRYMCGEIDSEEFKGLCQNTIPADIFEEKKQILSNFKDFINNANKFVQECNLQAKDQCQKCGQKATFFSIFFNPLKEFSGLKLCKRCIKNFKSVFNYAGFNGEYYYTNSYLYSIEELDEDKLNVMIQQKHMEFFK